MCVDYSSTACLRERVEAGGRERLGATGPPGRHQLLTAARVAAAHLEEGAHDHRERLTVQHRLDGLVVLLLRCLAGGALCLLRGGQAAARAASQWHRGVGGGCMRAASSWLYAVSLGRRRGTRVLLSARKYKEHTTESLDWARTQSGRAKRPKTCGPRRLQQTRLVRKRLPPVREARWGKHPDRAPPHPLRPGGVRGRRARVELAV